MSQYPEHDKLEKIKDFSQTCGEFLAWLNSEKGIQLAVYSKNNEHDGNLYLCNTPKRKLLAEFFEIDSDKLEAEKLQMLDRMREANEKLLRELKEGEKV